MHQGRPYVNTPIETGFLAHPHVQLIKDYQAAMARGDIASAATVFDPEVTYHVAGNNQVSGDFARPEAVMGYLGTLMYITDGTYRITHMNWLVGRDGRVALVTRNAATIAERSLVWDEAITFELKNNKKWRIDLYQADQAAVDAVYGERAA